MENLNDKIRWIEIAEIPIDIKDIIDKSGFIAVGICVDYKILIGKVINNFVCPEIIDGLCSNVDVCPYGAVEAASNQIILLNNPTVKKYTQKIGWIAEKVIPAARAKGKEKQDKEIHFDRATKKAFAKLKFELTKKVASENPNLNALKRALLEEFGISIIPPELVAVFNMEVKKNKAKELGMKFTDYILLESTKLKK